MQRQTHARPAPLSALLALAIGGFGAFGLPAPATAQAAPATAAARPAQPSAAMRQRAADLLALFARDGEDAASDEAMKALFAPSFLTHVPAAQVRSLAARLRAEHGAPLRVARIAPAGPATARIELDYARAVVGVTLTIEAQAPNRVIGLMVTDAVVRDDSLDKLVADLRALPGTAAFQIRRLDGDRGDAPPLAAWRADAQMATGSSFKLYLLAELARAAAAGERRWDAAVPLGPPALASGISQQWPRGAPVTLHTLATLAISISDNTAADTLLRALGRDRVDAMLARTGHAAPGRALPLLTTTEAFALKMKANAPLLERFRAGTAAERRALLGAEAGRLGLDAIDNSQLAGRPLHIDAAEWFASPADMARLLDWLRREGGREALAILAVNPGVAPGEAAKWRYLGYKGGSETGVLAMNFLAQAPDGGWWAVTGSWNDPAAAVDEPRFLALMSRALNLIPR